MGDERFPEKYIYFGIPEAKNFPPVKLVPTKTLRTIEPHLIMFRTSNFSELKGIQINLDMAATIFGPEIWIDRATVSTKQDTKGANNS